MPVPEVESQLPRPVQALCTYLPFCTSLRYHSPLSPPNFVFTHVRDEVSVPRRAPFQRFNPLFYLKAPGPDLVVIT